uniref:EF-hand domain-containing protein n=1 Tax=Pyrodinium bahamense TaxID=73915 RepID=A0A7S0B6C9_9DINO|mmetsp:Transcript_5179/g.14279  ORF Transcript_5179/g.14279 Transcript_5179/m.14279 type:complete len:599 (+) Transcript_5179:119-1915(+)
MWNPRLLRLMDKGTSGISSGAPNQESPVTLQILREELEVALSRHEKWVLEHIHGESPRDMRVASNTRYSIRRPSDDDNNEDDTPYPGWRANSSLRATVRSRHQWLKRSPTYIAGQADEDSDDVPVKRSFRAYQGPRRKTVRGVRRSSFHGASSNNIEHTSTDSETEDLPVEVPVKRRAPTSIINRSASDYFDRDTQPMMVSKHRSIGWANRWSKSLVEHPAFEYTCGIFVILNAVTLGIETNYQVTHRSQHIPKILSASEAWFCVLFTAEQALRLGAHGSRFFTMKGWTWNLFDLLVVSLQLMEQATHWLTVANISMDISIVRMCRVLRLIRITRLIRVVRLVHELRTLVASIMGSFKSLAWTLLLLMIVIYSCSVLFTQVVLDALDHEVPHAEDLDRWFGSLARTALTLFESILGGLSWEEAVQPLYLGVSPGVAIVFCFYVAFCVFALMNVVTGVFVEKAMQTAQDHKDMYLANHISELFFSTVEGGTEHITWEIFSEKMNSPDMQEYFKAINVDPAEAYGLFQLLDTDGNGGVDCEEIVNGLLRLRGNARALELSLLMSETARIYQHLVDMDRRVGSLSKYVTKASVSSRASSLM